jgi:hypothetical protein
LNARSSYILLPEESDIKAFASRELLGDLGKASFEKTDIVHKIKRRRKVSSS